MAAACCCRVVFPDDRIQFNGGQMVRTEKPLVRYLFIDVGKNKDDRTTLQPVECDWIPGGATMWRREWFERFPTHPEALGAFEDNEVCLRVRKAGGKLLNCPTATVVHHHHTFRDDTEPAYLAARYDRERILATLRLIYREHGLIIDDPEVYGMIGLEGANREDICHFFEGERQTQRESAMGR